VPEDQARVAKYILCATADDIVQNIPSEERHTWTQYSMLARFFGERVGGVRFFDELERAKADPSTNYGLLELMYACLSMGFAGVHRTSAGGAANLQMITRTLYEVLRRVRPRTTADLSPHWMGQDLPSSGATFRIPFWALSAMAAVLLFGLFVTLRILLSGNSEAVTDEMARLFPESAITIDRPAVAVPAPPAPVIKSTQLERILAALAEEVAAKKADAAESGNSIVIRVGDFATFTPGSATVLESFKPIAEKIAAALEKEPGDIRIVGHTDSTKISTARFPSNYELSLARANAVADLLKPKLSRPDRIKVEGKGDTQPVGANATAEGRARNRRVEISIPREETARSP
jgi:type VI secretion system protein ImpK